MSLLIAFLIGLVLGGVVVGVIIFGLLAWGAGAGEQEFDGI